ncbi:MAG: ribonucleotide reductase N-terminal alpha domain-containing protein, partial [Stenotrophomonas sp.]
MSTLRVDAIDDDLPDGQVPMQPASQDIWDRKYRLKTQQGEPLDADIDATYLRVAKALSDAEVTAEKQQYWMERFTWALRRGAIPAGRIISNAGAQAHKPATSTINCTVSGTIEDSMDGILQKVHEAGLTLKAGCGIGYEFSTLRPRGAFVAGAGAHTSGPMSFMDIFDKMCFTVSSAGGRRGAQMGTFDVSHPDVREFIRAKREDGRLRQFNLSLLITDGFMHAVDQDADWPLLFPLSRQEAGAFDLTDPARVQWRDWPTHRDYVVREDGQVACRVYGQIRARHLWDMIMVSTYDYAEPGFILIDRVNEMNNNWWCEDIRATNPCVTADTWVHTANGPRQVAELIGRRFQVRVEGQDHATTDAGFFLTARKPVLALQTREGHRLRLTADHRVRRVISRTRWAVQSEWCEAGRLRPGDEVLLQDHRAAPHWPGALAHEQGYLLGLLVGDGTLNAEAAVLSVW